MFQGLPEDCDCTRKGPGLDNDPQCSTATILVEVALVLLLAAPGQISLQLLFLYSAATDVGALFGREDPQHCIGRICVSAYLQVDMHLLLDMMMREDWCVPLTCT